MDPFYRKLLSVGLKETDPAAHHEWLRKTSELNADRKAAHAALLAAHGSPGHGPIATEAPKSPRIVTVFLPHGYQPPLRSRPPPSLLAEFSRPPQQQQPEMLPPPLPEVNQESKEKLQQKSTYSCAEPVTRPPTVYFDSPKVDQQ
jgi:hypothetical protein